MTAAAGPRHRPMHQPMLVLDAATGEISHQRIQDLPSVLRTGDLLIVNDSATLPASLPATFRGEKLELRLVSRIHDFEWQVVTFGSGDWRTPTELRAQPPVLRAGDRLDFGTGLNAIVKSVSVATPRLVNLRFSQSGAPLWQSIYALGRPIQYSHLREDLPLAAFQTTYGGRPWSVEMPSAGRPLVGELLLELRRSGVQIASLTHAAGLSSTGDEALDALLPLPERYEIPEATVSMIRETRSRGGRVIAVGTSVVRALEGRAYEFGHLSSGSGITDLRIEAGFRPGIVDGILTGVHDPTETHFDLLQAFAPAEELHQALKSAVLRGYRGHEFGDSMLILSRAGQGGVNNPDVHDT